MGTAIFVFILLLTSLNLGGGTPTAIAGMAAKIVAIALGISIAFDMRGGLRN